MMTAQHTHACMRIAEHTRPCMHACMHDYENQSPLPNTSYSSRCCHAFLHAYEYSLLIDCLVIRFQPSRCSPNGWLLARRTLPASPLKCRLTRTWWQEAAPTAPRLRFRQERT